MTKQTAVVQIQTEYERRLYRKSANSSTFSAPSGAERKPMGC